MGSRRSAVLVKGVLQVTVAMLAVAGFFGWLLSLAVMSRPQSNEWTPLVALALLTTLYGLLGVAAGSAMSRRLGRLGIVCAVLGTLTAWGVLEFFYYLYGVSSPGLRAPLIVAVPLSAIGAVVSLHRQQDRRVGGCAGVCGDDQGTEPRGRREADGGAGRGV